MFSWSKRVWDDWLKNGTPYHESGTFVTLFNLAVEIDEPPTSKNRECGAKETQLSLILVIAASRLILPIVICKFVL